MLAPIVILAIWGASYVWSCVVVLSAPGSAVEFKYASPGGPLRFYAESYAVDWERGTAIVQRPRLYGPQNTELASAASVHASGIQMPTPSAIVVRVRDVKGVLRRLRSGRFEFQDFLPKRQEPTAGIPFSVSVNRADLELVDEAGKTPFRQLAIVEDFEVRGVGDSWIAGGNLFAPEIGATELTLQNLPGQGFLLRGLTPGLDLARMLVHFRTTPEGSKAPLLREIEASTLRATGPFSVFVPANQSLRMQARLAVLGTSLRYSDYAADRARFEGVVSEAGAEGRIEASRGGTEASFNGAFNWMEEVTVGGRLAGRTPSSRDLPPWLRRLIPRPIMFAGGRFDGWLDYRAPGGLRLSGSATADRATVYGERVLQPAVDLAFEPAQLRLAIRNGSWVGAPLRGAVLIGLRRPSLVGEVGAANVDLAAVGERLGIRGLGGKAELDLLLGGTPTAPTAVMQARGEGGYRMGDRRLDGRFQVAGRYRNDTFTLERARIGGDAGSARALGTVDFKNRRLALKVDATGIDLSRLRDDLAGTIAASGLLEGTLDDPKFTGNALAVGVDVGGQQVPFATADLLADRRGIVAQDLHVIKGAGEASGVVALRWRDQALSGQISAENVLLNEYLGDQALGVVAIPELTLGGTLSQPVAAGVARGENLMLGGITVDRAEIRSSLKGSVARIDQMHVGIGEGAVSATGVYDFDAKAGRFTFQGQKLDLARIAPPGKGVSIVGMLDGNGVASVNSQGTWTGRATGALRDIALNETEFGNGSWALAYDGARVSGEASVGKLDRFLLLENVDYDTGTRVIQAQVSVLNGALRDLYTAANPFFPELSIEARRMLDSAAGDLDATVAFTGPITNPDLDVKLLQARGLSLRDAPLGTLEAALTKTGTAWRVSLFNWSGPQGTLMLTRADVDTEGDLFVDGELSNFDLKYVALVDPSWAKLRGNVTASFLAQGRTDSPTIRASVNNTEGTEFAVEGSSEVFRLNLHTITVSQADYLAGGGFTGGVDVSGTFYYRGFTGDVAAKVPLNFPLEIPDGPTITATLSFPDVDLKDVAGYAAMLDRDRSAGRLSGTVSIIGPKGKLGLEGAIAGNFDRLAFNGVQTTLGAVVAGVSLKDDTIVLQLEGTGSRGGTLASRMAATIPDLATALDRIARGDSQELLTNRLQGSVEAVAFRVQEDSAEREYGSYHATLNAKIDVAGPATAPLISGRVGIRETNVLLPSIFEGAGPSAEMLFNPRFELPIELEDTARFRSGLADVSLVGGGSLTGSLARPVFDASLTVEGGRLNLPTARLTLEEGGTMRPSYRISDDGRSLARVDVNLEGRTAVTALRYGDTVQRYDIRLGITGDLLTEGGLNLTATSDPPDLSRDEILALLGQTDVLTAIQSGTSQSEAERRIRDALVSVAVPQLTESFTRQIAQGLGLEYLGLEYNPFEGASLSFAKVLGRGLILQGRRQISPPLGNRTTNYDLRLTYRVPTRSRILNRTVFSIGLDQDRPWKVGLEYGFRF